MKDAVEDRNKATEEEEEEKEEERNRSGGKRRKKERERERERERRVCCEDEGPHSRGAAEHTVRMGATFRFDLLGLYRSNARGVT